MVNGSLNVVTIKHGEGGQFNRNNSNNIQTSIYRNLEPTEHPLMPTKVLITYRHFLVFARHTYLHLKKKFRVIGNGGIPRRTLKKMTFGAIIRLYSTL